MIIERAHKRYVAHMVFSVTRRQAEEMYKINVEEQR
jgi:hypothetical protein